MSDLQEQLEASADESGSRYPDWWDPADLDEGDTLQGEVADIRFPFEDDAPVMEVRPEDGPAYSTRPHAALGREIDTKDVSVGDMVLVRFEGEYQTDTGGTGFGYSLGVVHADELEGQNDDGAQEEQI